MAERLKIDWQSVQSYCDNGHSVRDAMIEFDIRSPRSFTLAVRSGKFVYSKRKRIGRKRLDTNIESVNVIVSEMYNSGMSCSDIRSAGYNNLDIQRARESGLLVPRTPKDAYKLSVSLGKRGKPNHSDEFIKKLSERQSIHNSGGRAKWFTVNGVNVQGTWERDIALKFCEMGVDWIKVRHPVKYIDDSGVTRRYTPDFYLPKDDVYLEVKGYWWGNDKRKMELVINQHPEMNIKIIQEELYKRIIYGERVW